LKTNINKITQYMVKQITDLGFDVFISYSHKSSSRYLEIILAQERKLVVRIADHPAGKENRWRFRFDIHTEIRRSGSLDYFEFLDTFRQIIGIK